MSSTIPYHDDIFDKVQTELTLLEFPVFSQDTNVNELQKIICNFMTISHNEISPRCPESLNPNDASRSEEYKDKIAKLVIQKLKNHTLYTDVKGRLNEKKKFSGKFCASKFGSKNYSRTQKFNTLAPMGPF